MLHCPKCDQLVNRHCKFCPHCGLPLADDAAGDATLMGSAPAALPATPLAMARQRGLLLYGGIAAGCLVLIIGIVMLAAGHSKTAGSPSALRPGTSRDALYGRAAIVNPGVSGSLMGGPARQVTPLGAPVLAQPMHGESFATPSAPTLMAQNSFGPGDLLAPPVTLYHPVYYDEQPPLSPLPKPQAAPAPGPVASAPAANMSGEPGQPVMSPFAPVAPAEPAASEEAPAPENPPATQPPAPAAATPPSGPTYINGGYGPAVGNYGYGGYPAFGGYGANGFGGYGGGYGGYGSPGFQNYANLPYGYPVLGPLGGYIRR